MLGILATPECVILAARGKAVEARDARLQSVGIDAELRGECLQRRRCRQQLTKNLPRLQPVQVHAARQQRSERIFTSVARTDGQIRGQVAVGVKIGRASWRERVCEYGEIL